MRELIFVVLELEEWCSNNATCDYCSGLRNKNNKAVCQIRTRSKLTDKIVQNDMVCESCKEKFENDELPKCECGRLKTRYTCDCKEESQEKELPVLPHERRPNAFYERQINTLREELTTAEWTINEEREVHEDFMEKSEEWSKRRKQELSHRIKELEAEVERLKKQTPQELINEVESYKEEVAQLKIQLEKLNSQQSAQIEVKRWPWLKVRK